MHAQPVALVTGANKGIGKQIAKELAAEGFSVLIGARDLEKGKTTAREIIASDATLDVRAVHIDVTDEASITAAYQQIRDEFARLDVLVNNAGISHAGSPGTPFDEILQNTRITAASMEDIRYIYEVNLFGVLAVTRAMLPLLREAPAARIVNLSSGAGSVTSQANPDNPSRHKFGLYSTSKAALNAVTLALAIDLEDSNIKVNAICPGFTSTDLNNFEGAQSVQEAARHPVSAALLGPDGPTGTFSNYSGVLPW